MISYDVGGPREFDKAFFVKPIDDEPNMIKQILGDHLGCSHTEVEVKPSTPRSVANNWTTFVAKFGNRRIPVIILQDKAHQYVVRQVQLKLENFYLFLSLIVGTKQIL